MYIYDVVGNSKYVTMPGGNLIITSVNVTTDTGVYSCTASNHNGNATDKAIGNVVVSLMIFSEFIYLHYNCC